MSSFQTWRQGNRRDCIVILLLVMLALTVCQCCLMAHSVQSDSVSCAADLRAIDVVLHIPGHK